MDQIKELQEQIEALKKTVNELQSGTVRVETNTAKEIAEQLKTVITHKIQCMDSVQWTKKKESGNIGIKEVS